MQFSFEKLHVNVSWLPGCNLSTLMVAEPLIDWCFQKKKKTPNGQTSSISFTFGVQLQSWRFVCLFVSCFFADVVKASCHNAILLARASCYCYDVSPENEITFLFKTIKKPNLDMHYAMWRHRVSIVDCEHTEMTDSVFISPPVHLEPLQKYSFHSICTGSWENRLEYCNFLWGCLPQGSYKILFTSKVS